MSAVYVHLSSRDIDDKILTVDGVKQEEEPAQDPMAAVICPRCRMSNPPDNMYCGRCSCALNDAALKNLKVLEDAREDPDALIDYANWLKSRKETITFG
jgi:uncharacterized paraquat-inducible protein A